MRVIHALGVLWVVLLASACGNNNEPEPEEAPMRVEDTVFGDLVGAQDKARDHANEAVDVHREALEERLGEDEGATSEE